MQEQITPETVTFLGTLAVFVIVFSYAWTKQKTTTKLLTEQLARYQMLLSRKLNAIEKTQQRLSTQLVRLGKDVDRFHELLSSNSVEASEISREVKHLKARTNSLIKWKEHIEDLE